MWWYHKPHFENQLGWHEQKRNPRTQDHLKCTIVINTITIQPAKLNKKQRCWFSCWCCCPVEWTNWKELRKKSMMEFEGIFWTVSTFAEWTPVKSQQRIWRKKEEEVVEGMHIIMNNNSSSTNNKKTWSLWWWRWRQRGSEKDKLILFQFFRVACLCGGVAWIRKMVLFLSLRSYPAASFTQVSSLCMCAFYAVMLK